MVHRTPCQDLTCCCIHPEDRAAGICDDVAVHQDRAAHCAGIIAFAQLVGPVEGTCLRRNRDPGIRHSIVIVVSPEVGPLRGNGGIDGRIRRCLSQGPGDRCRTAVSLFRHDMLLLSVQDHQLVGIVAGHGQKPGSAHITVLGQGVGIAVAFAKLELSVVVRPQPLPGQHLPDIQKGFCGRDLKGSLYRGRFQDIYRIGSCSGRCLGVLHRDCHCLGIHRAVQFDIRPTGIGHIGPVDQHPVSDLFFPVAKVLRITGDIQCQGHGCHRDLYGIHFLGRVKADGPVLLQQHRGSAVAAGRNVFQTQKPLEIHHIILIAGHTVDHPCEAKGQPVFNGVLIHQESVELDACGQPGIQFGAKLFSVINITCEKLVINRFDGRILLTADPHIDIVLRIHAGNLIVVTICRKGRVQRQCILIFGSLGRAEGKLCQPILHIPKIHFDDAVGNLLQRELVCDVVIGIIGCDIAVGLTGNQCIFIAVLCFRLLVRGIGHHHAVAVDHLNGNGFVGNKGKGLALSRLDIQPVAVGNAAGSHFHCDSRFSQDLHRSPILGLLPVHHDGITLHQGNGPDIYACHRIQDLVCVFRDRPGEGRCGCLVRPVLIRYLDRCQGRDPGEGDGIVLGIGISVCSLTAEPVDYSISLGTSGQDAVSAAVQGFKRNTLFHKVSCCILHGIHSSQSWCLFQQFLIVFGIGIHRAHKAVKNRNRYASSVPSTQLEFCIRKFILLVGFRAVAAGKPEGLLHKPQLRRKAGAYRCCCGHIDAAGKGKAVMSHTEGVGTLGQFQLAVTVIFPLLTVGIGSGDGNAGIVGIGISLASVGEVDRVLGAGQGAFIITDGFIQLRGQGPGIIAADAHKGRSCRIIGSLRSLLHIRILCQILRHGSHQLFQTFRGFAFRGGPLAEAVMGHRGRRCGQVIAAVLVTAGIVTRDAVNSSYLSQLQSREGMPAGFQGLTNGLAGGIGDIFRRDHQPAAGFCHQNEFSGGGFFRTGCGGHQARRQYHGQQQTDKPHPLYSSHRSISFPEVNTGTAPTSATVFCTTSHVYLRFGSSCPGMPEHFPDGALPWDGC